MIQKQRLATIKKSRFSLVPDFIADSVTKIDFARLASLGIKAVFIDLDGTVVSRNTYEISDRIRNAMADSGLQIYIATNRPKRWDLKNLIKDLGAHGAVHPQYLFFKPTKRYFMKGLKDHGFRPHEAVMIGDRFVQDIFGSNRAGMYSLLVYKLDKPKGKFDQALSRAEKKLALRLSRTYVQY